MPQATPLPYYAREDLAYLDGVYHSAAPVGTVWEATVDTGFLERIIFGHFTLKTGPTVADRTPSVQFVDQYNATLWVAAGNATVPASSTAQITFGTQFTSAYSIGTTFVVPIPDTILEPDAAIFFQALNFQPDDQVTQLNYYRILIPTGPPIENEQATSVGAIPTPIVL